MKAGERTFQIDVCAVAPANKPYGARSCPELTRRLFFRGNDLGSESEPEV